MKFKLLITAIVCLNAGFANAELSKEDMNLSSGSSKSQADYRQRAEIVEQLKVLDNSISVLKKEIDENKSNIKDSKSKIDELTENQEKLEEKLDDELIHFNKVATSILKIGQIPSEVTVLQDALQVQQKRAGTLAMLKTQLALDIDKSKSELVDLASNLEEQKQNKSDLTQFQNRLETKIIEFSELRKQQQAVLRLPAEIRLKMQEDAVLLANDIDLDDFLKKAKETSVKTVTHMSDEKLPIEGKIVINYHDKDRITQLPVQGITIEGFGRGKIKALHDGRVIYSGVFRNYGHLVILEHQTGAHSLYAGFGKAIIDVGDYVNAGDLMGFLPAEEEPTLYFEVRINNEAQEPTQWLEKDLNLI